MLRKDSRGLSGCSNMCGEEFGAHVGDGMSKNGANPISHKEIWLKGVAASHRSDGSSG